MSFFKKLKDRLFRSSDKIGDGLDALVSDGAEELAPEPLGSAETAGDVGGPSARGQAVSPAAIAEPEPAPAPTPVQSPTPAPAPSPAAAPAPRRFLHRPRSLRRSPAAPSPAPPPKQAPTVAAAPAPEAPAAKPGFLGRILGRSAPEEARRVLDDAMLESLEELLIQADMGVDTAVRVTANIAEGRFGRKVSASELRGALAAEVARIMEPVARPMPLYPKSRRSCWWWA
jgi:fused signal recognition particle receptor